MSLSAHGKWLRIAWLGFALTLIAYMIVLPAVDAARQRPPCCTRSSGGRASITPALGGPAPAAASSICWS